MALPEPEEFARRRKKLGLTQQKLADIVKLSRSSITKFETNWISLKYDDVKTIDSELSIREYKGKSAKDVMVKKVSFLSSSDNLRKAIDIMKEKGFSQLPVIQKNKIIGSITETGVIDTILKYNQDAFNKEMSEIMEEELPFVGCNENMETLRLKLKNRPAVLVMDKSKLVGIISRADVLVN